MIFLPFPQDLGIFPQKSAFLDGFSGISRKVFDLDQFANRIWIPRSISRQMSLIALKSDENWGNRRKYPKSLHKNETFPVAVTKKISGEWPGWFSTTLWVGNKLTIGRLDRGWCHGGSFFLNHFCSFKDATPYRCCATLSPTRYFGARQIRLLSTWGALCVWNLILQVNTCIYLIRYEFSSPWFRRYRPSKMRLCSDDAWL